MHCQDTPVGVAFQSAGGLGPAVDRRQPGPSAGDGLVLQHEVIVPVFLPAILVGFTADLLFLAVANGLELRRADAARCQGLHRSAGATFSQSQVVHGRATLVAVTLDLDLPVWVLADNLCGLSHSLLRFRPQVGLVVVEVNVPYRLGEDFVIRRRRWWRRWWGWRRSGDGYGSGGILRSAEALCAEMIGGGVGRSNGLGTGRVNLVAFQGDFGGGFGAPGQHSGLAALNRCRVCRQGGGYGFRRRWRWWWRLFLFSASDSQRQQG